MAVQLLYPPFVGDPAMMQAVEYCGLEQPPIATYQQHVHQHKDRRC